MFQKPKTVKLTPYEKAQKAWGKRKVALLLAKGMGVVKKELKRAKKSKRIKRIKLPTIHSLVLKADQKFAAYIRNRDGNKCILCGSTKNPTCGHLIKRGKKATRWDEVNCNCLCSGCNYKDNFEHDHYVLWFLREYGQPMYEDLLERSKCIVKLNREYLTKIIEQYDIKKP